MSTTPIGDTTVPPKTPVSPKVVISTVLAFVAPALVAALSYIADNGVSIIGIENPILGTLVIALISSAVTFLGGYLKRDPIRESGARRALAE
jgi:hypothetical protein